MYGNVFYRVVFMVSEKNVFRKIYIVLKNKSMLEI